LPLLRCRRDTGAGAESYALAGGDAGEIAGWNIDIDREGHSFHRERHGRHGMRCSIGNARPSRRKGEGGIGDDCRRAGTLATPKPVRTVGKLLALRPDIVRYIRRAMRRTRRNRKQ